jgi:lipopolysaccharide/colanic/teichoic acid biosynthesis glycosyltransferase
MRLHINNILNPVFNSGNKYHWNVPGFLVGLDPLFVRRMPLWKRLIDVIFSGIGIVFISPLILFFAILIKVNSPGPVFFKQERVGYGGKMFTMFKLRTMKQNSDTSIHKKYLSKLIHADDNADATSSTGVMKKLENDSRIVPFGNFMRKAGIDELPQLINVLFGDMSLIGPRPPISYEVDEYKNWFSDRFDIVPGLTGLWQVSGKNNLTFHEMIRLDIQYIRNQSFGMDLKILLLTPVAILKIVKD